jgi:hypothetical protein
MILDRQLPYSLEPVEIAGKECVFTTLDVALEEVTAPQHLNRFVRVETVDTFGSVD